MADTREWCAISGFRFQEFVAPDRAYGLVAKNWGHLWKLSARGRWILLPRTAMLSRQYRCTALY